MKTITVVLPSGQALHYVDRKRWWWLLSILFPLQPFIGIWLHAETGLALWLAVGFVFTFLLGPLGDAMLGEDRNNPPQAVVPALEQDRWYRWLTWAAVPVHVVTFVGCLAYATTADVGMAGFLALALGAGMAAGLAINTGHELGHKNSRLERTLARVALAVPAYGHFSLDHNRGHHRDVATPADPASARMGENIYRFAVREIPGAVRRAWHLELERLANRGKPAWHPSNQLLQAWLLAAGIAALLVLAFGWLALPFLLLHHTMAYFQLTSANYIEHYGLLRERRPDGRLERCGARHSWNSNHVLSNLALFHLERHSDHHVHPLRRYQSLRHLEEAPRLPTGYFGMYLLAWVPPLWFRVMDPRLLALPHVAGDLGRVNLCPRAAARLQGKYGSRDGRCPGAVT